jgi:predicted dienelactone hydrolase
MEITPAGMKTTSADRLKVNYSDHSAIKMKKIWDIPHDVEPMIDQLLRSASSDNMDMDYWYGE